LKKAFEGQLAQLDVWLAAQAQVSVLRVPYHRVVSDARAVAADVNAFLGLDLDTAAMARAVDPTLHRQRGPANGAA
jgi:hypothetical protein